VTTGASPGYEDGGSTVLSLNLQWDQGTAGASWVTLLGESPHATTDRYTVQLDQGGGDAGKTFKFRSRAYNVHGWGPLSEAAGILAADFPGPIAGTTIEQVGGTEVKLAWQTPDANGSPVDAYRVEVLASSGSYLEETTHCSGAVDPTVLSAASCQVPMSAFSSAPFSLARGAQIAFRVTAQNQIGWQASPSGPTTGLVLVETAPLGAPAAPALDASQTDEGQIRVTMAEIPDGASAANGGSPILSYSLEWDAGFTGTGFTALTGSTSDSLERSHVATGLSAGAVYEFRYRVRNVHGWGDHSPSLAAIAAKAPSTPAQPVTSNSGTSARIDWTEPYHGGSAITALEIEIRTATGTAYAAEPLYCNGVSDATVLAQGYCVIPMSVLRAAPYSLGQGDLVVARMRASNAAGVSPYSEDDVVGGQSYADVRTAPLTPPVPPTRGAATTTS
jgi:hypothetical protein